MEDLRDTQSKSDLQLLESRAYLDKKERDHQKEVDRLQLDIERQLRLHSDLIGKWNIKWGRKFLHFIQPRRHFIAKGRRIKILIE